jgi:hypothetical protein
MRLGNWTITCIGWWNWYGYQYDETADGEKVPITHVPYWTWEWQWVPKARFLYARFLGLEISGNW